jgi:cytidylate kinase
LLHLFAGVPETRRPEHNVSMNSQSKRVVICIAGLTACGKSTAAKRLAERFNLKYASGGTALKELALKMGYKAQEKGWWEAAEGMRFLEQRSRDSRFDKQIDDELLKLASRGSIVMDSWTMPWLYKEGFKIWLEVSPEERARRLMGRDGIGREDARQIVKRKDGKTKEIYEHIYGFKLGDDYSPFDLILDSECLSAEEVFDVLCFVVERLVVKQSR